MLTSISHAVMIVSNHEKDQPFSLGELTEVPLCLPASPPRTLVVSVPLSGPSCIGVGTKVFEETVNSSVVVLVTGMCELDVVCRFAVDLGVDRFQDFLVRDTD